MLLMSIAFPILTSLGISPLSAATAVVMGSFIDWGPNDSSAIFAAEKVVGIPMIDYFLRWQLPACLILIAVCAIFLPLWLSRCDKKNQQAGSIGLQGKVVEDSNCPAWYALFPIAPIVLIVVFAFIPTITLDVTTANLLCLIIVFFVEVVRRRSKDVTTDMSFVMKAMGTSFASVVSILVGAAVFAKAIEILGGMAVISGLLASVSRVPILVVAAMSLVTFFGGFVMGSGNASWYAFGPLVPSMTEQMGIATQSVALPMQLATSMGRSMSPVSAVIIAVSGMAGLDLQELSRSCMVPAAVMFICNILVSYCIGTFL
jgi:DcuC family C4-dicarboxylate transporter